MHDNGTHLSAVSGVGDEAGHHVVGPTAACEVKLTHLRGLVVVQGVAEGGELVKHRRAG